MSGWHERFGVRLGLLMEHHDEIEGRPFGALTPFAQTVTRLAQEEGITVIAFDPDDLEVEEDWVEAWQYLGPVGGWEQVGTTLPDVIWNRYFRKDEGDLLAELAAARVPVFNPPALSKWEAHLCLKGDPTLAPLLPETRLLTDAESLFAMLEEFPVLFMKPVRGSVGKGIVRIRADEPGTAVLQYVSTESKGMREVRANKAKMARWIDTRRAAGRFLIQQGLELDVFHGRPADVRILVQKDEEARWQVTGMGARVAAHGRFTSNLHTGGQGVSMGLLAGAVFPDEPERQERLVADLEALALQVARRVESRAGAMAEVGLDFGISPGGRIWFIEQNAQPGRAIFEQIGRPEISRLAHLRPVRYAAWLAAQKSEAVGLGAAAT